MTPVEQMREDAANLLEEANAPEAAKAIRALPLPSEATEPTDTARMKAALEIAVDALVYFGCECSISCDIGNLNSCSNKKATDALTAIRKALGET